MKIYKDTITHYRRNKLDDHAACGDDLLGRRNEDQLDPFNTTCRNCLISTGRHHSPFQNIVNWIELTQTGLPDVVSIEDMSWLHEYDSFTRVVKVEVNDRTTEQWRVEFNHQWVIDRIVFIAYDPKEEDTK